MRTIRWLRRRAHVWDGHVFINLLIVSPAADDTAGRLPARFAPWRMGELRTCIASSTTCEPTGS